MPTKNSVDVVLVVVLVVEVVSQKHMRGSVSVTMATSSSVHLGKILKINSILIHMCMFWILWIYGFKVRSCFIGTGRLFTAAKWTCSTRSGDRARGPGGRGEGALS